MVENNTTYGTGAISRNLFGRRIILSTEPVITSQNVSAVVEQAYLDHLVNRDEIQYLWDYYKGKQPILSRVREVRNELTQKIVENRANEIVSFKSGYIAGKPIQYISSVSDESVSANVERLNDKMRVIGKHTKDRELIEWELICGIGYRYIVQNVDRTLDVPFNLYTLDPRSTFVIRANDFTRSVIAAVNYVTDRNENVTFTVYTRDYVYTFTKGGGAVKTSLNTFGLIPIIEYQANTARQGCFEICLSMLDAINDFDSCRLEAVEAFVQSLLVLYNCQVEDGVTADSIRQAGMILLKSVGDAKADIKVLAEQLDQTQNQTLKDDMYQSVLQICGVPSQSASGTSDSSNNGAVVLKNGWEGAETRAQDFETMFKLPEQETLKVVSILCSGLSDISFNPTDIDVKFTRRNYENILSKSQTLVTMLAQDKIHPKSAYEASGLFIDVEEAYQLGMKWYKDQQDKQQKQMEKQMKITQQKEAVDGDEQ